VSFFVKFEISLAPSFSDDHTLLRPLGIADIIAADCWWSNRG
jgi:hypothetical protein